MHLISQGKNGDYDVIVGTSITVAITEAIALSAKKKQSITFKFNGATATVNEDSNSKLIHRDLLRAIEGSINKNVGPYPNPILTDAEKANDARIEARNKRERQKKQVEYEKKDRIRRKQVQDKLKNTPAIELTNKLVWEKFKDANKVGYGNAVITYAERWARLMQLEITNGKKLEDVAEDTSYEANIEGITIAMYGYAVSILVRCWKYGERLRRWHNLQTQIGDEGEKANKNGGVLNPAVLHVGSK